METTLEISYNVTPDADALNEYLKEMTTRMGYSSYELIAVGDNEQGGKKLLHLGEGNGIDLQHAYYHVVHQKLPEGARRYKMTPDVGDFAELIREAMSDPEISEQLKELNELIDKLSERKAE